MNKNTLILVVEDEDEIADILMSYLERSGMKTLRARQGEQAIALNRLHKPDLILLDIHLPVCDGWSVLTTLRQESAVPVIMVSALDQDVDKLMGLRLGADDYVIKPSTLLKLSHGLRRCCAGQTRASAGGFPAAQNAIYYGLSG
jgi:two-component system response regulator AdeR